MKKSRMVFLGLIILVVILILFYFKYFTIKKCDTIECFNSALEKCKEASYIDNTPVALWKYNIQGKANAECFIAVKIIEAKQGKIEIGILEGKEMVCYLPFGVVAKPQADLTNCHGRLKEDIQELIIKNTQKYITDNLGKIEDVL